MTPLLWMRIAITAAVFAAGAAVGWGLNGWRLNSKVADLTVKLANSESRVAVLEPANAKCAVDVADVRQAFAELKAAEAKRAAAALAAITKAKLVAEANFETARLTMEAARPPAGQECPAIITEERNYVQIRQKR